MEDHTRDDLLYHYTRTPTALEYIFPSLKIRMGAPPDMNDPRETSPWEFLWGTFDPLGPWFHANSDESTIEDIDAEFRSKDRKLDRLLRLSARMACFTADRPLFLEDREYASLDVRHEDLQLPGYLHDRMWAQYADNHKGVCIVFDRERLLKSVREYFGDRGQLVSGSVAYVLDPGAAFYNHYYDDVRDLGDTGYARHLRKQKPGHLYLTKSVDWLSEEEFRVVWISEDDIDDKPELVPVEGCIVALYLGSRFPEAYHLNVRTLRDQLGIDVYTMKSSFGRLMRAPASLK